MASVACLWGVKPCWFGPRSRGSALLRQWVNMDERSFQPALISEIGLTSSVWLALWRRMTWDISQGG